MSISNSILARLVGQDQLDRLIGDSANIVSAGLSGPLFSEPACKLQSVVRDEHDSSEESLTSTFCKGGKKKRPMKSEPTVAQHTSGKQRRGLCKEQPNKRRRTAKKDGIPLQPCFMSLIRGGGGIRSRSVGSEQVELFDVLKDKLALTQ